MKDTSSRRPSNRQFRPIPLLFMEEEDRVLENVHSGHEQMGEARSVLVQQKKVDAFIDDDPTIRVVPKRRINVDDEVTQRLETPHISRNIAPDNTYDKTNNIEMLDTLSLYVFGAKKLTTPILPPDEDDDFEKQSTIPMLVLKDISHRQGTEAQQMQSEISGAAGNAAVIGIGNIIGSILKFGSNYLLQVGFGASAYGLYSIGFSMVTFVAAIFNLGFGDAAVRYTSIYQGKQQISSLRGLGIFCSAIAGIMGLLGAIFIFFYAPVLAEGKHEPALAPLIQLMAPMVPFLCMQTVWFGALQGFKAFKWRMISDRILQPLILLLLTAGCFLFYRKIEGVALAVVISTIVGTVASLYFLFTIISGFVKSGPERYEVREWLSFATLNFLTSLTEIVLESVDTLLLAILAVPGLQVGLYNAAIKFSDFIAMPMFSVNTMFAPTIAELYSKGETEKLNAMFKVVTKWAITFSLPIFFVVSLFTQSLLGLSGSTFVAAWPLMVVSAVGSMINSATGIVGYMLVMTGKQKLSFFDSFLALVLNIIFGVLLIPKLGAMGTAIGTTVTLGLVSVIRLLQVRFLLKLQPFSWGTLKPIGAGMVSAACTGGLLFLFRHINLLFLLAFIPVFLIGYIAMLFLLKASPEDQIVLASLKKKFLRGKSK